MTGIKMIANRAVGVFLSIVMVLTSVTVALPTAYSAEETAADVGTVTVTCDGEEVSSVTVPQDDTVTLTATPSVSGSELQWEILAEAADNEDDEVWATIYGETDEDLVVNYALASGLMDSSGSVYLRCTATNDSGEAASNRVKAKVSFIYSESTLEQKAKANADGDSTDDDENVVTLTVNYLDKNGSKVYSPYTAQYKKNDETTAVTLTSPNYAGYVPICAWDNDINISGYDNSYDAAYKIYNADNAQTAETVTVNSFVITEDVTINVYYTPIYVYYTVEYYFQNLTDDEYTEDESITVRQKALTGEIIADEEIDAGLANKKDSDGNLDAAGYTALYHIPTEVAGDGSTVISSYYDRRYFLYSFDLDGGHSCEPVYARYGSEFKVNEPTKAGYQFVGWTFVSATDSDGKITEATGNISLTSGETCTMPYQNRTYKAKWESKNTDITIVYWREQVDDSTSTGGITKDGITYEYWGSREGVKAASGTYIDIENMTSTDYTDKTAHPLTDITQTMMTESDTAYQNRVNTTSYWKRFDLADYDKDVLVQGDGSTVINVYYTRKTYTLRMVYARSVVVTEKIKTAIENAGGDSPTVGEPLYQVYGGNSRFFGAGTSSTANTSLSPAGCKDLDSDGNTDDDDYLIFNLKNSSGMGQTDWYKSNGNGKWANVTALPTLSSSYTDSWESVKTNTKTLDYYDYSTGKTLTWTYYYISLTTKYGYKVDDAWVGNLFEPIELCSESKATSGTKESYSYAYYASVQGEYFVRYSQDNISNPTIKGTYQRLDDDLLFNMMDTSGETSGDTIASEDFNTVSYLAIWENAAKNETWNTPCMWTYNCYVQTLGNDTSTDFYVTTKQNGKVYLEKEPVVISERIGDNHTSGLVYSNGWNEFPAAMEGFTFLGIKTGYDTQDGYRVSGDKGSRQWDKTLNYTEDTYNGESMQHYTVEFYFVRNSYKLQFYNYNSFVSKDYLTEKFPSATVNTVGDNNIAYISVEYEAPLSDYEFTPEYPDDLEVGAYEFKGWYTSPTFDEDTKVDWKNFTMPASDVKFYAKWSAKDHSARIFDSYSNMVKFQNQSVVTDKSLLADLNAIVHSSTYETDDGWVAYIQAAFDKADKDGTVTTDGLAVIYEGETRYYVREGSYYYRVNTPDTDYASAEDMPSRFHNSLFTLDGVKYVYVDEVSVDTGTRVGYVRADGLIDVRHRPHGEVIGSIDNPTDPTGNGKVFSGWMYVNSSGAQTAFAPLNSPLTSDMDLYADWSSKQNVPYLIHYASKVVIDDTTLAQALTDKVSSLQNNITAEYGGNTYVYLTGEDTSDSDKGWHLLIADDSTGYRFDGTTHTFTPKSMTSLYEAYRGGEDGYYYPTSSGHSIQMATTTDAIDNSYTFLYVKVENIEYTVNYVDSDGNVLDEPTKESTIFSIVTAKYKTISGYLPDASYKTLVLSVDENGESSENNVITFVYTASDNTTTYIVHYMMENLSGDTSGTKYGTGYYTENTDRRQTETAEIGTDVTVSPLDFTGFTMCDAAQNVYVDSTTSNETTGSLTASSGSFKFTPVANGNDIYIYYNRNTYDYNVYYLEAGTDTSDTSKITKTLAATKTVKDVQYGKTVTENAEDLSEIGYMYQTYSLSLTVSTKDNNIFFFYDSLQYTVEFVISGDEEGATLSSTQQTITTKTGVSFNSSTVTVKDGYIFGGWYYDEACTDAVKTESNKSETDKAYVNGETSNDNCVTITPITANIPANNTDGNATTKFYAKITSIKKYVYFDPNGGRINGTAYSGENLYKVESSWLAVNLPSLATAYKDGYTFDYWYYTDGDGNIVKVDDDTIFQTIAEATVLGASATSEVTITLTAAWKEATVVFHTNYDTYGIKDSSGNTLNDSTFREYYFTADSSHTYELTDGTITQFDEIPTAHVNNDWIFAGWYYGEEEDNTKVLTWSDTFTGATDLYAHWIENGTVEQESDDDKVLDDSAYKEFGLAGVQIRTAADDPNYPNKTTDDDAFADDGLRFITSVSESLLTELKALNNAIPQYGYVVTTSSILIDALTDKVKYSVDDQALVKESYTVTSTTDKTAKKTPVTRDLTSQVGTTKGASTTNSSGSSYTISSDHYNGTNYRLYSFVITYSNNADKSKNVCIRSYIDYTDANGVRRTYYNDYTNSSNEVKACNACVTTYNDVYKLVEAYKAKSTGTTAEESGEEQSSGTTETSENQNETSE